MDHKEETLLSIPQGSEVEGRSDLVDPLQVPPSTPRIVGAYIIVLCLLGVGFARTFFGSGGFLLSGLLSAILILVLFLLLVVSLIHARDRITIVFTYRKKIRKYQNNLRALLSIASLTGTDDDDASRTIDDVSQTMLLAKVANGVPIKIETKENRKETNNEGIS